MEQLIPILISILIIAGAYILIPPIIYTRYGKLKRLALAKPSNRLTLRLARGKAKHGALDWKIALDLLTLGYPGPAHLQSVNGDCPNSETIWKIRGEGYYEIITLLNSKKCNIPEQVLEEAVTFHLLAGQREKLESIGYKSKNPLITLLYCNDGVVEYWTGAKIYSSEKLPPKARIRIWNNLDPSRIASAIGAGFTAVWGCPGGKDASDIISIAYPEIPKSVKAIQYHLGIGGPPSKVIGEALISSLKILADLDLLENLELPGWLKPMLTKSWKPKCEIERGIVIVTDHPKASCPTWSPEIPSPSRVNSKNIDNRALAAIYSLHYRMGDWRKALTWSHERAWGEEFEKLVLESLEPSREPPIDGGFQVYPSDVRRIRSSKYKLVFRCMKPRMDCIEEAGLRPEGPPKARLRVHSLSNTLRGVVEAVAAAERDWSGNSRTLYIVPTRLAARIVGGTLKLKTIVEPWDVDDWLEGPAVASWRETLTMPWIINIADDIVLVYPESFPGVPEKASKTKEWIQWLAYQITPQMISRFAYHSEVSLEGSNEIPKIHQVALRRDWIVEEANLVFGEAWKGLKLRPYQEDIITAIIEMAVEKPGQPVFSILPTGSGKSAIFQVAGKLLKGLGMGAYTLIVSPLRALMRDQVEGARRRGFRAERIDASVSGSKKKLIYRESAMGIVDLLYVTPERFMEESFTNLLIANPPALVVLDEAHTLARWGPSFRPSYLHAARMIADLRETDNWPPIALFTATSPPQMVSEILDSLNNSIGSIVEVDLSSNTSYDWPEKGALVFQGPVVRDEIKFRVEPAPSGADRVDQLASLVKELGDWARQVSQPWIGLVYTGYVKRTRKEWENAEILADLLAEKTGMRVISYHGQLSSHERRKRENEIYRASIEGPPTIIVATKAFGMGVDIPNIRWVIHFTPSESIEDYYQEVGRAARDGKPAIAVSLYNPEDFQERLKMIRAQRTTPSSIAITYNSLYTLWAKIREKTGGNPQIVLPRETIYPDPLSLKTLNSLQRLGYLEYWALKTTLTAYKFRRDHEPSDYLPWYMELGNRIVIGPENNLGPVAEKLDLEIYRCPNTNYTYKPLALKVDGTIISTGQCKEPIRIDTRNTNIIVVNMSLDHEHKIITTFPPREYAKITSSMWMDEEKLDALRRLMEEALARSRKSPEDVDYTVKNTIKEYFSKTLYLREGDPPSILGYKEACPKISDCIADIVEVVREASKWLGERAVTLAIQEEDLETTIVRSLSQQLGKPFEGRWKGMYRRIVTVSRKGRIPLMDYGFIVAIVKATGRRSVLTERLSGYPYSALFMYTTS